MPYDSEYTTRKEKQQKSTQEIDHLFCALMHKAFNGEFVT